MTRRRIAAGALGAAMTAVALVPVPAQAAAGQASAACSMTLGTVTVQGDHKFQRITATSPVTASTPSVGPKALFPVDQVSLATSVGWEPDPPSGTAESGYVRINTDLYRFRYVTVSGQLDPASLEKTRVGGGWVHQTYLERSVYYGVTSPRAYTYALDGDVITRWNVAGSVWRNKATYNGFSAVKTMALISQTATYDTFLANTRGGALYTIRIPVSGKPVVKVVRRSTWQGFESLVADSCGTKTIVLGVDKETGAPYLYEFGHANGTATVIKAFGKVPRTFNEAAYSRFFEDNQEYEQLFGE